MRKLFDIGITNYNVNGTAFRRPSARAIIIRDGKIGMIHSLKYDYFKFPGGGIESNESQIDALIREVREEAGLIVLPDTIKEYGYVHRVEKGMKEELFIQDNYYYLCDTETEVHLQCLDDYEAEEMFILEYVEPLQAITTNREKEKDCTYIKRNMLEREVLILELLIQEQLL